MMYLLKIVLMLLLVRRKRSMFSTVCKKIRHENRYDQCVPTSVIKATRRGCCPSRAGSAWTPTPSELWFPQLSHFLKTDESYCYPSSSQWEWHVPTNQTFAPINCMMEDRFISHDFPAINVPMQQMSTPTSKNMTKIILPLRVKWNLENNGTFGRFMVIVSVYHRQCKQKPKALLLPLYFRSMQALNMQGICYLLIDYFSLQFHPRSN